MRCILKCRIETPSQIMLNTLKWMKISQKLKLNTLLTVFKIKHNMAPKYLTENITMVREAQTYPLRNENDFRIRMQRTTLAQNSLFYKGLKIFNELPRNLKNENNIHVFKRLCKHFIVNESA